MRSTLMSFAVKAALFLLIANIVMLLFVPFGTAEWYITVISAGLMTILIAVVKVISVIRGRKNRE